MSKKKPNIVTPFDDKERFKNLVQEVINDTTIFSHIPNSLSLSGDLFTVTLSNKKFVFEDIKVDSSSDYVDVYLTGIKKPSSTYSVTDNGTDIVINFTENITLAPELVVVTDFSVKGKIVSR
tara:strand:- start:451 stop:816 length:366 start_codon:yes stop_codon:yes gene_type:complete